ncbi:MAG TPA: MOSC domain-containing protein [Streptosporangiaceae bacterium]|nr:MOSC domain-containing protein [Streptosporangiaceae bacterium]
MANARVISVNTGRTRAAGWAGRIQRSAIDKRPAAGPLAIGHLGVQGDEQADAEHHGGVEQAVYAYAREDLDWWVEQLGLELGNGTFGENLTTAGLDVSGALLGETWQVGTAVVQVRSVRIPCGVFAGWMGEQYAAQRGWVKRFAAAGRPGAYLKVLAEGRAGPGDPIEVLHRPTASVTVTEALRAYYGDAELMRRLVAVKDRDPAWDDVAEAVLARAAG